MSNTLPERSFSNLSRLACLVVLAGAFVACADDNDGTVGPDASTAAPSALSVSPGDGATGVDLNQNVRVSFSEAMNPASITTTTFRLTSGSPAVSVAGVVSYAGKVAFFTPSARLLANTMYRATVTSGAMNVSNVPLRANVTWTFTTGAAIGSVATVPLGAAGGFAILAKSGISTVPTSAITGNIGVSPAAATYITGFALVVDASNRFATSTQVTDRVFAADYAAPTPVDLTAAVADMQFALVDAGARTPDVTELGAGDISGMTLAPGVYSWGTGLGISTDVTLAGNSTGVWIFQVAQDLTVASGVRVTLAGGALAKNVFWQVTGAVDVGTGAHVEGIVLCSTAITLRTGASANGRLLASTAVSIDTSTVVEPAP